MPSRAVLLYGFRGTEPLIVKIPTTVASAQAEADVAKALLVTDKVPPHLVGPVDLISFAAGSVVEVADEHRSARAGLVMPLYASTLVGSKGPHGGGSSKAVQPFPAPMTEACSEPRGADTQGTW